MSPCLRSAVVLVFALIACGPSERGQIFDAPPTGPVDACIGAECNLPNCLAMGLPPTTLTGTVFAPNGTLPLFDVNVYVPRDALPPIADELTCDQCGTDLAGAPIVHTSTDAAGHFVLEGVPAGDYDVVVSIGKWRRVVPVRGVAACETTALDPAATRLPRDSSEGHLPRIALTTGEYDSLECLLRKLGIADSEITHRNSTGRVHLYASNGVDVFAPDFGAVGNQSMASAQLLWNNADALANYDLVLLSCEGSQISPSTGKTVTAMQALKAYADGGGRVFASHWHNVWVAGNYLDNPSLQPPVWTEIATWGDDTGAVSPVIIDELDNPKGVDFASWMLNVGGSAVRGEIALTGGAGHNTAKLLTPMRAERWVRTNDTIGHPQMFQFTTPNEQPTSARCGKVVFADMHVSDTSNVSQPFPDSCPGGRSDLTLSPQELALAFMFFDISSCTNAIE